MDDPLANAVRHDDDAPDDDDAAGDAAVAGAAMGAAAGAGGGAMPTEANEAEERHQLVGETAEADWCGDGCCGIGG
ncbi:MAG: hypothetical protein VXY90_13745, partial [Pseudomonadota bacterium]|nr:hypothetical protein [Pseudomonadota bacterium]